MKKLKRVTVRITEQQDQRLNELSELMDKNVSYLVSEMIDFCIRDSKNLIYNKEIVYTHLLNVVNLVDSLEVLDDYQLNHKNKLKKELEELMCHL